ncbi:MAG: RNA methyltransferase, partial [Candidatus Binataceae bacterium]
IASAGKAASRRPALVYTSAREKGGMSFEELRERLAPADAPPIMIMLGTGFGLAPAVKERAEMVLAPIRGAGEYNHLSVRAAAAIILDRIRGM